MLSPSVISMDKVNLRHIQGGPPSLRLFNSFRGHIQSLTLGKEATFLQTFTTHARAHTQAIWMQVFPLPLAKLKHRILCYGWDLVYRFLGIYTVIPFGVQPSWVGSEKIHLSPFRIKYHLFLLSLRWPIPSVNLDFQKQRTGHFPRRPRNVQLLRL